MSPKVERKQLIVADTSDSHQETDTVMSKLPNI